MSKSSRGDDIGGPSGPIDLDVLEDLGAVMDAELEDPVVRAAYEDTLRRGRLIDSLRRERKRAGLNQAAVAKAMGTAQSAVSDIENGRGEPHLATMQRYARAIGRRVDVAVVPTDMPAFDELTAWQLWQELSKRTLGVLFENLATRPPEQCTLKQLAEWVDVRETVLLQLLNSLVAGGWVSRGGEFEDVIYAVGEKANRAIGVHVEHDQVRGVLTDQRMHVLHARQHRLVNASPREVTEAVSSLVADLHALCEDQEVIGVGVSIAGVVDAVTGEVEFAPDLQSKAHPWHGVQLEGDLENRIQKQFNGLRVFVENDANALATHQYLARAGQDRSRHRREASFVAVVLLTSTGIGSGLVVDGIVVHGANSRAGEGGHAVVDSSGAACRAGLEHNGCLETLASAQTMFDRLGIGTENGSARAFSLLSSQAAAGDGDTLAVLNEAGQAVGRFVSSLITHSDPGQVIFFAHPELTDTAFRSAKQFQQGVSAGCSELGKTDFEWMPIEPDSLAVAAAAVVTRDFLSKPHHWTPSILDSVLLPQ